MEGIPNLAPFEAPESLESRLGVTFLLRLGANESAFGPSPKAVEAIQRQATSVAYYGDPQSVSLRNLLSLRPATDPRRIWVTAGIDELLCLFVRVLADPGEVVAHSWRTDATL